MLIIVGFGRRKKNDLGEIIVVECPRCNNEVSYHLIHTRTWLTLYFIPVLPYRNERRLECPICSHGMRVSRNEIKSIRQGEIGILKYLEQTAESTIIAINK
jgi:hypothetical protein